MGATQHLRDVYVVDAIRTPIGRYGGALRSVRPDDLLAGQIRALLDRQPSVDPMAIEDVIAGDANQAGEDTRNVARMAALLAGLPCEVPGNTVNRLCGSGLQAVMDAARAIQCGDGELLVAGGVESMTRAPWVMAKQDAPFSRKWEMHDSTIGWRFVNPRFAQRYPTLSMGETAERVAETWKLSREAQDAYAWQSHQRYFYALTQGLWEQEIVPVSVSPSREAPQLVGQDEHPRHISLDSLARLRPAFVPGGSVTAGNSSGLNDGASVLLLASEAALKRFGLVPMARIRAMAVAGVDPSLMGIGPVPATHKALGRAGLRVQDLDLVELNEAFASQVLACMTELDLDPGRTNVHGGAIALGHPMGASGARLLTTLVHELRRRPRARYAMATLCVGLGQGLSLVLERC